jgi:hypothetical protein
MHIEKPPDAPNPHIMTHAAEPSTLKPAPQ